MDQNIDEVNATPEDYEKFVGIIRMASSKHIPRGWKTNFIPGLTDEWNTLYEAYQEQYRFNPLGDGTIDARNKLIELMAEQKKERWLQTTQPTSGGAVTANSNCCANCVEPPRPLQLGPDLPFFVHAGHADPLDGWRCCSLKRVMSRPIQVRQLQTRKSGFAISAINKYLSESRYP